VHEAGRVIRDDRGDAFLRGCQQGLRLRPGAQCREVDARDRTRNGRQFGAAGVDGADASSDPAKLLETREAGLDRLVARALDMLDQQHCSRVIGTSGDDTRHRDASSASQRHPAHLERLGLRRLRRADPQHGAARAAGILVTHQPRRAAPAQARHGNQANPADGRNSPLNNGFVESDVRHQAHATRLSGAGHATWASSVVGRIGGPRSAATSRRRPSPEGNPARRIWWEVAEWH
jgi:hypothetical protein